MNTSIDTEDDRLWAKITEDITPMPGKKPKPVEHLTTPKKPKNPSEPVQHMVQALNSVQPEQPLRPEPNLLRQVKQGRRKIEGLLDLHGMTQTEAHAATLKFITHSYATQKKIVLIITGKGPKLEGVLRKNLPYWLDTQPHVYSYCEADIKHGGSGAFYVFFKKKNIKP